LTKVSKKIKIIAWKESSIRLNVTWDGAVSNARTYTLEDMDIFLEGLNSQGYTWEKGIIKGKSRKVYLLGLPKK
jgi:hypothetical protein